MATIEKNITRNNFPKDFVFGCATSAYQVEGAYNADGKSMNNWDAFSLRRPDKIQDGSNGCLAIDHYNRYKEDVMYCKKLGLDAYRFSINWSRVLPGGRLSCGVNREGVQFYNNLIDFCVEQGIKPYVTIFHFDVPQCLEDEYCGFLSEKIREDFVEFAELCFWEFGDRVKYWITQNEPWSFTHNGYVTGGFPPGRGNAKAVGITNPAIREFIATPHRNIKKDESDAVSNPGDAGTEPYTVAHNLIIAHAKAVDVYRKKFQAVQGGKIGVTNMTTWYVPLNENDPKDVAAASRAVDFMWGWFMAPIVHGDYPNTMREKLGGRLPTFTSEEREIVLRSYDFIGLNYYTTHYAIHQDIDENTKPTYYTDQQAAFLKAKDYIPIGECPGSDWLYIVPEGIYNLLKHTKEKYNDPLIYITEHGMSTKNNPAKPVADARKDEVRVRCYRDHLWWVREAIKADVNVKAYFLWSMFDNYEWSEGYKSRFGIFYVDFVNGLARYPKDSALWWMKFLKKESDKRESEENSTKNKVSSEKRQNEDIKENAMVKRTKLADD